MKLDYPGDSGIAEPRGNVRIQTQTTAQGLLSAMGMLHQVRLESATHAQHEAIGARSEHHNPPTKQQDCFKPERSDGRSILPPQQAE